MRPSYILDGSFHWYHRYGMTTPLDKTLKRALRIKGVDYIVAVSPDSLKLTLKGRRIGLELKWAELVDGEAALATALNASLGKLVANKPDKPAKKRQARKGR
jgi:hypothetical protein